MSNRDGTILAYASSTPTGVKKERHELTGPEVRFTSLLSREAWNPLKGTRDEKRTRSAICFPGWDRD